MAAGTLAAWIQSIIGNVAAGSLFAQLQSIGALGLGAVLGGPMGAVLGGHIGFILAFILLCLVYLCCCL